MHSKNTGRCGKVIEFALHLKGLCAWEVLTGHSFSHTDDLCKIRNKLKKKKMNRLRSSEYVTVIPLVFIFDYEPVGWHSVSEKCFFLFLEIDSFFFFRKGGTERSLLRSLWKIRFSLEEDQLLTPTVLWKSMNSAHIILLCVPGKLKFVNWQS